MSRQITGTLKLPDGSALANTKFDLVALRNEGVAIVKESRFSFTTDGAGAYNATLQDGWYAVMLTQSAAEIRIGEIVVTTGAATTLEALLSVNGSAADPLDAALLQLVTDAQTAEANAAASAAAALVSEGLADTDAIATAADVVTTNADAATVATDKGLVNTDKIAVAADLVLTNQDTIDTAADASATAADVITVAADKAIVATDKGIVSTDKGIVAADKALVATDRTAVAADLVLTNQDTIDTAADLVATNQDTIDTAADVITTTADKAATAADVITTTADVATVAADKTTVATDKGIVAADKATVATDKGIVATDKGIVAADKALVAADKGYAEEWANKAEDSLVSSAAGGDLVDDYSAMHHAAKAAASAATVAGGLVFKGPHDASGGVAPATPAGDPNEKSDFYKISVAGTINSIAYAVNDNIVWDTSANAWFKIDNTEIPFGTTAGTVSEGNHNHSGVYLPIAGKAADSELLDGINGADYVRRDNTFTAGHHAEGRLLRSAALTNDFANVRRRGSTFTLTNVSPSDDQIDDMFDGLSSFYSINTAATTWPIVIEFTLPRTLTYGATVGIGFGNTSWICDTVKIEAFSEGAWVTCVDTTSNSAEDILVSIPGNSGVGTTKMRYTLGTPPGASTRLTHLWGYNYNSAMWSELQMPRAGGTMYGDFDVSGNVTLTGTVDGRDIAADGTKLNGIETSATADQTNDEIKTAYEANADTNAFDDAEQTKLAGIATGAEVNAVDSVAGKTGAVTLVKGDVGLGNVLNRTISYGTAAPTGGVAGDIYFRHS